jgi:hypothetical protein
VQRRDEAGIALGGIATGGIGARPATRSRMGESSVRLGTSTAMPVSLCWAGRLRARSFGPTSGVAADRGGLRDDLNLAIAPALRVGVLPARHRRCARRDDDVGRRIGLMARMARGLAGAPSN